jgi:hypothetical protein
MSNFQMQHGDCVWQKCQYWFLRLPALQARKAYGQSGGSLEMLGAIQVRRPPFIDWAGWYFPQESKATSDDQLAGILLQLNDSVTP